MKQKIIKLLERIFIGEHQHGEPVGKPSYKTTMPFQNITFEEWQNNGVWSRALNGAL